MSHFDTSLGGERRRLPETALELISALRRREDPKFGLTFDTFCERYWKPVYCYIRGGWSKTSDDAKDLAQSFFLWLYQGDELMEYEPVKGSFRNYFKAVLRHYLANQERLRTAQKRGGLSRRLPPALESAALDSIPSGDPDKGFDTLWMNEIVERAVETVRYNDVGTPREIQFRVFEKYHLGKSPAPPTYAEIAESLDLKPGDVRNHLTAVRGRIRAAVRAELESTAEDPKFMGDEWEAFFNG